MTPLGDDWTDDERREYAAQIRAHEEREQAIIDAGVDLLAARWDAPLAAADAYDLANIEVRTDPETGELTEQRTEVYRPGMPSHETIEETLGPLTQEVEDQRNRDDDGRPRPG